MRILSFKHYVQVQKLRQKIIFKYKFYKKKLVRGLKNITSALDTKNRTQQAPESKEVAFNMIPKNLLGRSIVVTSFYNPAHYNILCTNYQKFWQKLKLQNVPLFTVELACNGDNFLLNKDDATYLLQVRSNSILWQKERLLNVAIDALPDIYDSVIFLDADCYFTANNWHHLVTEKLQSYAFVQPYSRVVRLPRNVEYVPYTSLKKVRDEGGWYHGFCTGLEQYGSAAFGDFNAHGEVGMCIAARREVLQKNYLYDASIVAGAGDTMLLYALFNKKPNMLQICSLKLANHYQGWAAKFYKNVSHSIGYVDQTLYHYWHGSRANRQYWDRNYITSYCKYDPHTDIAVNKEGAWEWASDKPVFHSLVRQYFQQRNEDD